MLGEKKEGRMTEGREVDRKEGREEEKRERKKWGKRSKRSRTYTILTEVSEASMSQVGLYDFRSLFKIECNEHIIRFTF